LAGYVASLHQARLRSGADVFYGIDGKTRGGQALVRSLHFLTVYSNLASDENEEQINYHNSLLCKQTVCENKPLSPGDRNGRTLSYGKIRAGKICRVLVYVDIAGGDTADFGQLHTTSPSSRMTGSPGDTHPWYSSAVDHDCCIVELVRES